jgi:copper transport protein
VSDPAYAILLSATRVVEYVGFVLLAGMLMFLSVVWPQGRRDPSLVRLVVVGIVLVTIGTIAEPFVESVGYDVGVLDAVGRQHGAAALIRLAVLAAVLLYLPDLVARDIHRWRTAVALVAVLLLEATFVVQGDAVDGRWAPLKVIAVLGHLTATAVWLGGLAALAAMLVSGERLNELQVILPSFRGIAIFSVVTLLVTGALHALVAAGGLGPLLDSRYGAALGVKTGILALMLMIGDRVRRYAGRTAYRPLNEFSRTTVPVASRALTVAIGTEVALAAAVLVATAVVVWFAP